MFLSYHPVFVFLFLIEEMFQIHFSMSKCLPTYPPFADSRQLPLFHSGNFIPAEYALCITVDPEAGCLRYEVLSLM